MRRLVHPYGMRRSSSTGASFIWISSTSQEKLIRTSNFREELHVILVQAKDDSGGRLQGVQTPNRTPSQRRPLSSSLILTGRRQTTGFLFHSDMTSLQKRTAETPGAQRVKNEPRWRTSRPRRVYEGKMPSLSGEM